MSGYFLVQVFNKDIHIILSGRIQPPLPLFGEKSLKLMGYFGKFGPLFSEILDLPLNFTN